MKLTQIPPAWYCAFWVSVILSGALLLVWMPELRAHRREATAGLVAALALTWLLLLRGGA